MPSTPNSNNLSPRVQRTTVPVVAAAVAFACLAVDFAVRFTGNFGVPWMRTLETIAFLALAVGAAAVVLRSRAKQAAQAAAEYKPDDSSQLPRFQIADGGTGLPVRQSQNNRGKMPDRAPSFDGGSFRSQSWKRPPRR